MQQLACRRRAHLHTPRRSAISQLDQRKDTSSCRSSSCFYQRVRTSVPGTSSVRAFTEFKSHAGIKIMGGLLTLLSLSAVMAVASFLAGVVPLSFSLSRSQLRLISTVGMGVLVGTSLIVIIPEGIETLYRADDLVHSHTRRATNLRSTGVQWEGTAGHAIQKRLEFTVGGAFDIPGSALLDTLDNPPKAPMDPRKVGILGTEQHPSAEGDKGEPHHAWTGVALIAGFILMFLIDKVPQLKPAPTPKTKTHRIALNHIGRRFNLSGNQDREEEENEGFLEADHTSEAPKRGSATTIGLIIHAAADGIALGASSSTTHTRLSLIIFFAIMIHKAPAAFGLTSILLQQGLSKKTIRAHLALFSLAAPIGALLTWMTARFLGSGAADNSARTQWWTGLLLLFSAGTFLYVAMHSMQEILGGHSEKAEASTHVNGSLERRDSNIEQHDDHKLAFKDIAAAVFGMILPLFLQVGHAH